MIQGRRTPQSQRVPHVVHVGVVGDLPGGIAQVINGYLGWKSPDYGISAIRTSKGAGDRFSIIRAAFAAVGFLVSLRRSSKTLCVVHLSQRGSFVREGAFLFIARALGLPRAAQIHGSNFVSFSSRWPRLAFRVLSQANTIFVLTEPTESAVERLLTKFGPSNVRVVRINNTVAVPTGPLSKGRTVIMAGELGERKGVDVLLEAWSLLSREAAGWKLQLAGPVKGEVSIPESADIELLGILPHEDLMTHIERASIAVLVARNEALPMFLLEAMARRCAVITTGVGQIPELISDDCGIEVPPGDIPRTRDGLALLINDSETRDKVATRGHRRIEQKYSVSVVRPVVESEWLTLLGRESASASAS